MKLIGDTADLILWLCLSMSHDQLITISRDINDQVIYGFLKMGLKIGGRVLFPPSPNHVYK